MAPSPELGLQTKAPDKASSSSLTGNSASNSNKYQSENLANHMATAASAIDYCSSTNTSTPATSNDVTISSAPEKLSKNLRHWKDNELKELLDEAYSYKNPKDRENKSETFLQLLAKVEREKDNHFPAITGSRYQRGSNSHKHGGSLQDLAEVTTNDILDSDYSYGKNNRRHHHNSRTKKYSSVSSRQREGGSLPSNVNVSNCNLSIYEPPFLNEVENTDQNERTCSAILYASITSGTSSNISTYGQESTASSESRDDSSTGDTVVDNGDGAPEDGSQPQQVDENGNAIVSKKKKKFQSDRNTTTLNIQSVEGYRGRDTIASLVKFIESKETETIELSKKTEKMLPVMTKKKEKKKDKDIKKDLQKVKKCTSLEELRSCTKLDDEKLEPEVTMRTKGKKGNAVLVGTSIDGKETVKQHVKRGERRSWGTEELTYLGENNAIEEVRERNKEREKSKRSKESLEKQDRFESVEKIALNKKKRDRSLSVISMESVQSETAEFHIVTKKKRSKKRQTFGESRPVCNMSTLSRNCSGHKKYQSSSSFSNDRDAYLPHNLHDSRRKSTSSVPPSEKSDSSDLDSVHSLPIESTNNRNHIFNSSQMQQQSYAEIARTVNLNDNYALTSPPIDKICKWPAVSPTLLNYSTSVPTDVPIVSNNTGLDETRPSYNKSNSLIKDFPDLITDRTNNNHDGTSSCSSSSSTSTIVKQISYSQSLGDGRLANDSIKTSNKSPAITATTVVTKLTDVIKSNNNVKQILQKSKSVEHESYYNIDQYPALEKTVKKHAVQTVSNEIKITHKVISSASSPPISCSISKHPRMSSLYQESTTSDSGNGIVANISSSSTSSNMSTSSSIKSKNVFNNLNNFHTTATASSSNKSTWNSNDVISSNGKKSKANIKFIESSSILVEENNAKNSKQQSNVTSSGDKISVCVLQNSNSINYSKKIKSDPLQMMVGGPISRNTKKDKSYIFANSSNPSTINKRQQVAARNSIRPAVIILNDNTDSTMCINNDITFGDFNEEELHLFGNKHNIIDSNTSNVSGQDICSSISNTSGVVREYIHLSSHSDLGYSSSNNRSMICEPTDESKVAVISQSKLNVSSEYASKITTISPLALNPSTDYKPLLNKTSLLHNDSAILLAAQNCLTPNNTHQEQQSVMINFDPKASSKNVKVLSNNNGSSKKNIIYEKSREMSNELIYCDTNITGNNVDKNFSLANVNKNNTIAMSQGNASNIVSKTIKYPLAFNNLIEAAIAEEGRNNSSNFIRTAAGTANIARNTGTIQKSSCDNSNMKKISKNTINIRFVAPPMTHEINSINYDRIVDFVGLAWEDILHGVNGETEFYDGQ